MWMAHASSTAMKKDENGGTNPTYRNRRKVTTSLKLHRSGKAVPARMRVPGGHKPPRPIHPIHYKRRCAEIQDPTTIVLPTAMSHGESLGGGCERKTKGADWQKDK